MREWIELQIAVGVDHVWVADDNPRSSHDPTSGILKHYERLGYVTIIPPPKLTHPGCQQLSGPDGVHNCAPVKHCFEYASPHVKWLLFADTDEFIFPHNGCSLKEHINSSCNPNATHIYVKWERFGTSGFEAHPNGLMLENFLTSGGTCEKFYPGCGQSPFRNCPECRHSKVIYNTECAALEHAGFIHWPVNTTDWKAGTISEYKKRQWAKSPGDGGNWKKDTCDYTGLVQDTSNCNAWAIAGGGSRRPKEYTPDCCTGGIGYNHYGTQSRQYYERKQKNKKDSLRGWRAPLHIIDLNDVLSFSMLRFLRAVRKRFIGMGAQVSDNVDFIDLPGGKSCFVETNFVYGAMDMTETYVYEDEFNTTRKCCMACHVVEMCKAFTFTNETCSLLIGAKHTFNASIEDNQYQIDANRSWSLHDVSGIPLKEGECVPRTQYRPP